MQMPEMMGWPGRRNPSPRRRSRWQIEEVDLKVLILPKPRLSIFYPLSTILSASSNADLLGRREIGKSIVIRRLSQQADQTFAVI
jgi:hypothetical protein